MTGHVRDTNTISTGGYSGTGFVDGYWNSGATTTFTVNAAAAGNHTAKLRYANGTGQARTLSLIVNGVKTQVTLPATANWDTWADHTATVILNSGNNTITYKYDIGDSGNVNLDYLSLASGGGGGCTSVAVTFDVNATTYWGQNVYVTGSISPLSNWNTGSAIALPPAAYPQWRGTVNIPPGTNFEYKYIKKDGGNVVWESGANRSHTTSTTNCTVTLTDTWR